MLGYLGHREEQVKNAARIIDDAVIGVSNVD